jgi:hypothetical protein
VYICNALACSLSLSRARGVRRRSYYLLVRREGRRPPDHFRGPSLGKGRGLVPEHLEEGVGEPSLGRAQPREPGVVKGAHHLAVGLHQRRGCWRPLGRCPTRRGRGGCSRGGAPPPRRGKVKDPLTLGGGGGRGGRDQALGGRHRGGRGAGRWRGRGGGRRGQRGKVRRARPRRQQQRARSRIPKRERERHAEQQERPENKNTPFMKHALMGKRPK